MKTDIYINGLSSLSCLGSTEEQVWQSYQSPQHALIRNAQGDWVAELRKEDEFRLSDLQSHDKNYKKLDRSVLMAINCCENLINKVQPQSLSFGINLGSSRGATSVFEDSHSDYLLKGKTPTLTSPNTTLGNLSSWVSQHLSTQGPEFSHSVTCSTSMHALLNAVAWMRAGMQESFLIGGSEAPLTGFTLAQMKALGIYASAGDSNSPCRALDLDKTQNSMVLGEAAVALFLEKQKTAQSLAKIAGIGYGNEKLTHATSMSRQADCLQKSMNMALQNFDSSQIDIVITHTPGTVHGDSAEMKAVDAVFASHKPAITTNKWKIGHTLGSSGLMSVELALLMMKHGQFIEVPYLKEQVKASKFNHILINSVGFGGNAVSVLLEKA